MTSGPTSGRVYDALRERLTHRAIKPGDRIDPAQFAAEFGSSVTPVRDALHILIGQGLVAFGVSEGFHVPHIDEPGLNDLYDWNVDLLLASLRRRAGEARDEQPLPSYPGDSSSLTAALFSRIAQRSGSREHALAMRWANARFAPVRLAEQEVLSQVGEEVTALRAALESKDSAVIRRIIGRYHTRRKRAAGHIVRALYRSPGEIPII